LIKSVNVFSAGGIHRRYLCFAQIFDLARKSNAKIAGALLRGNFTADFGGKK